MFSMGFDWFFSTAHFLMQCIFLVFSMKICARIAFSASFCRTPSYVVFTKWLKTRFLTFWDLTTLLLSSTIVLTFIFLCFCCSYPVQLVSISAFSHCGSLFGRGLWFVKFHDRPMWLHHHQLCCIMVPLHSFYTGSFKAFPILIALLSIDPQCFPVSSYWWPWSFLPLYMSEAQMPPYLPSTQMKTPWSSCIYQWVVPIHLGHSWGDLIT